MIPSVYSSAVSPLAVRLGARQVRLRAYAYTALRSMELVAAWIALAPRTRDKIVLGTKLGIDAMHLRRLATRLDEMCLPDPAPAATAAIESNFTRAVEITDVGEQLRFLAAMSRDAQRSMVAYREAESDCADEPSVLLLDSIGTELVGIAGRLDRQADEHGSALPFSLVPLEAGVVDAPLTYSENAPIPPLVAFPVREESLTFANEPAPFGVGFDRDALRGFFHYMFIDVEVSAAEICARMIVEYRHMPIEFKVDMARQCWDEVRHAVLAIDALHWSGAKEGDSPYCAIVWRRYMSGESLGERLAMQQLVQEGNSCDRAVSIARGLRRAGHIAIADIMDQVTADEVIHVRFGNRWLMHLCNGSTEQYEQVVTAAQAKLSFPMVAVNPVLRQMAGFPPFFMKNLEAEFKRQTAAREAAPRRTA